MKTIKRLVGPGNYRQQLEVRSKAWLKMGSTAEALEAMGGYLSRHVGRLTLEEVGLLGLIACILKPGATDGIHRALGTMRGVNYVRKESPRDIERREHSAFMQLVGLVKKGGRRPGSSFGKLGHICLESGAGHEPNIWGEEPREFSEVR